MSPNPYLQAVTGSAPTSSRGSSSNPYLNAVGGAAPKKSGGGGLLGDLTSAGHWIAQKSEKAASDIKQIPGGFVALDKAVAHDLVKATGAHGPSWLIPSGSGSYELPAMGKATLNQVGTTLAHPLRDPFMTALTVAPVVSAAGRVAEVGEAAGRAGSLSENLAKFKAPRTLRQGDLEVGLSPTSRNAAVRYAQRAYQGVVQKALDTEKPNRLQNRVAIHGEKRISGQIREAARPLERIQLIPANLLNSAAKELRGPVWKRLAVKDRQVAQRALDLTSQNVFPREAALAHEVWGNGKLAALFHEMDRQGVIRRGASGDAEINAEKFPKLAAADAELAKVQAAGEQIIKDQRLMSEEGRQGRIDAPGQIIRAAIPETERMGSIYGMRGRGFTSAATSEGRVPRNAVARSSGLVTGKQRSPIPASKSYQGAEMMAGRLPANIVRAASQHLQQLVRYRNTDVMRRTWLKSGSNIKRTPDDVLVRDPDAKAPPLTREQKIAVGKESDLTQPEVQKSLAQHIDEMFKGGWKGAQAQAEAHHLGAKAPFGYKWVSRHVIGDQAAAFADSRGALGRVGDKTNQLITSMTVYLKFGHVGTRVLTNATLNMVEGSLNPYQIIKSSGPLWRNLSHEERQQALALSGQHGFDAMPHEGGGKIGALATAGANWWARHADAPFRFNSIVYQARKAGFHGADGFREYLAKATNPDSLDPAERARIEEIGKRANRENISYDRLSDKEKRFVARYIWFYPWVKGATLNAVRTTLEHPYKSFAGGQLAQQGGQVQQRILGDLPTYERGLIPLGGGSHPLTTDFSTFVPWSTAANTLDAIARPKTIGGQLSPAYGSLVPLLFGINSFGATTKRPVSDAISQVFSPTPEAQILSAYLGRHQDQSKRMFEKTPLSQLYRAVAGPAMPRRVNVAAANKAAARERSGR